MKSASERFWSKVEKTDDCWLWTGTVGDHGFGVFQLNGRLVKAHRHAYGFVEDGHVLDHLCRVRRCVNPAHLEPVSRAESHRRAMYARTEEEYEDMSDPI